MSSRPASGSTVTPTVAANAAHSSVLALPAGGSTEPPSLPAVSPGVMPSGWASGAIAGVLASADFLAVRLRGARVGAGGVRPVGVHGARPGGQSAVRTAVVR